jgi:hypothetical protein
VKKPKLPKKPKLAKAPPIVDVTSGNCPFTTIWSEEEKRADRARQPVFDALTALQTAFVKGESNAGRVKLPARPANANDCGPWMDACYSLDASPGLAKAPGMVDQALQALATALRT